MEISLLKVSWKIFIIDRAREGVHATISCFGPINLLDFAVRARGGCPEAEAAFGAPAKPRAGGRGCGCGPRPGEAEPAVGGRPRYRARRAFTDRPALPAETGRRRETALSGSVSYLHQRTPRGRVGRQLAGRAIGPRVLTRPVRAPNRVVRHRRSAEGKPRRRGRPKTDLNLPARGQFSAQGSPPGRDGAKRRVAFQCAEPGRLLKRRQERRCGGASHGSPRACVPDASFFSKIVAGGPQYFGDDTGFSRFALTTFKMMGVQARGSAAPPLP